VYNINSNKFLTISISLFLIFLSIKSFSQAPIYQIVKGVPNPTFQNYQNAYNEYYSNKDLDTMKGWKRFRRLENFLQDRIYNSKIPDLVKVFEEAQYNRIQFNKSKVNQIQSVKWTSLGPNSNPSGNQTGVGRINCVRINPNNNDLWVGSATGGAYKSTNSGLNWLEVSNSSFLSMGISDIAFSLSNPNVIYMATGDYDGTIGTAGSYYSIGLIKSTNAGNTWQATNLYYELSSLFSISKVYVNPTNENLIIVTSSSGIIKSTDGGITWKNTQNGSFADLEQKPGTANTLYASTFSINGAGEIYKSIDEGSTWIRVDKITDCVRINLAVTPANPNKVFALAGKLSNSAFHSIRVSSNSGDTFTELTNPNLSGNILGWNDGGDNNGQSPYDLSFAINPSNENEMYIGGVNIWKSINGGYAWSLFTHWSGGYSKTYVHADVHDLIFNKSDDLYSGTDGGIDNYKNSTKAWTNLNKGLNITQYYKFGLSNELNPKIIAGAQDNGTTLYSLDNWKKVAGGDGMEAAIDQNDPLKMYNSIYYGKLSKSTNGGTNFSTMLDTTTLRVTYKSPEGCGWITPFVIDPIDSKILYAGYNNIWKNTNYGDRNSWAKISNFGYTGNNIIKGIAVAKSDNKSIYAFNINAIHYTSDGGANWNMIYASNSAITYLAIDSKNPKRIFITKSGFNLKDKVFEIVGSKVINRSGNLPNVPINTIVYHENSPDRIYIGTDIGVYYSDYSSNKWLPLGDLPFLIINELEINSKNNKLYAATYGKGVWFTDLIDFSQTQPKVNIIGKLEFCKGDSVILESISDFSEYNWSNGAKTKRIVIKESTEIYLEVPNSSNTEYTSKSEALIINVLAVDSITIGIANNKSNYVCEGDSIRLSAGFGYKSYSWSDGQTSRSIDVKKTGKYFVSAFNQSGCATISNSINVFVLPIPDIFSIETVGKNLKAPLANQYEWFLNGILIDSSNTQTIEVSKTGKYKVRILKNGFCWGESDELEILTDVNENISNNVPAIYPNPNNGVLNLFLNDNFNNTKLIEVFTLEGLKILDLKEFYPQTKIDISKYSTGFYFVKVTTTVSVYYLKIVKEL
jgi:photosystem II stability/assembly factor-like uncharacterized protein